MRTHVSVYSMTHGKSGMQTTYFDEARILMHFAVS
jgi:hypothetical protein